MSYTTSFQLSYTKTGIPGLDEMLEGNGIPRGYVVFVLGSPGSGKTTLALQYLYNGAVMYGEPGVYVSLDEDVNTIKRNAKRFGWDFEHLENQGMIEMVDASPIRLVKGEVRLGEYSIGKREFQMITLINAIKNAVSKVDAKRLVVDPTTTFVVQYPTEAERRYALMDLMQALASTGCTTLMISELLSNSLDRTYQFEEYLAQGVILMRYVSKPSNGVMRSIQIEKMRAVDHDVQPRPYKITQKGVEIYTSEIVI